MTELETAAANAVERRRWAAPFCRGKTVVEVPCLEVPCLLVGASWEPALLDPVALDYTGIHPDPAEVERLALTRPGSFAVGQLDAIPLPDGFADVIVCLEGLDTAPDQIAAIQEWYRVLAPSGRLCLALTGAIATLGLRGFDAAWGLFLAPDQWRDIDLFHQHGIVAPSPVLAGYNPSAAVLLLTGVKR